MERIELVVFRSELSAGASMDVVHARMLSELREEFEIVLRSPGEERAGSGFAVAFIASGGSERSFTEHYGVLPRPLFLLTDGLANSLAASLEILAWINERGGRAELLHGDGPGIRKRLSEAIADAAVRRSVRESRIGLLGGLSDWLVASAVDRGAARARWGTEFVDIGLDELDRFLSHADGTEAGRIADSFMKGASSIREPNGSDVAAAARVYVALSKLAAEYRLDALTLKCFDMLGQHRTTGCLALALLNREGIVAGCEGDQRTAFTMLLARNLTGGPSFMANPASVDAEAGTAIFAHCTIAPSLARRYSIRSHFESGIGVAIQGEIPEGPATLIKIGGEGLDRYFVSDGTILGNPDDPACCRTQVRIALEEDPRYFLCSPLSNHHVIVPGKHARRIADFLDGVGLARVR